MCTKMAETFALHGPDHETIYKTLPEYLLAKVDEHIGNGKATYTIDGVSGESFTYQQYKDLSRNLASAMFKRGLKKGDTVAYMQIDTVKLQLMFMGIWRANGNVRGIYPEEIEGSVLEILLESKVKLLFCESSVLEICASAAKNVPWKIEIILLNRTPVDGHISIYDLFEDDGKALVSNPRCADCPALEIGPEDPAVLISTSGTTGRSKGALYLHKELTTSSSMASWVFPFSENKPNFILGKAPHISAVSVLMMLLFEGKVSLVIPQLTNENILKAVKNYKPGFIFGFPALLVTLVSDITIEQFDKHCIESIITTGTTIDPSLEGQLKSKLPNLKHFGIGYGATECAPVSMSFGKGKLDDEVTKFPGCPPTSMGKLCPGTSLQIRDADTGNILRPNQEGEICVKSVIMFDKYFLQPQETKDAFTSDGWFRTGDTGYADENGFLFHVGRIKEMFKCAGNHVYPSQIDEVIFKHPAVQQVCTIGIPDPNGGSEKIPRAFVTLKPGVSASPEEIIIFAHKNLPSYKHLTGGLYILSDLPKGPTGKITRLLVAKMCSPSTISNK